MFEHTGVLVVDDSFVARSFLTHRLTEMGYAVTQAKDVAEAKDVLTRGGAELFDCLITDYHMPGETGVDLVSWMYGQGIALASVITSSNDDRAIIAQALRSGASDFLDKPGTEAELLHALQKAVAATRRRREAAAMKNSIRSIALMQHYLQLRELPEDWPVEVTIRYHPRHEAGGDSVTLHKFGGSKMMAVMSDVAGHDLKAAYSSAYFQGLLRGCLDNHMDIRLILENVNKMLMDELGNLGLGPASLAVGCFIFDVETRRIRTLNAGMPLAVQIDASGFPNSLGNGGQPLGWFADGYLREHTCQFNTGGSILMWTDGMEEHALQNDVTPLSLAYRILAEGSDATPAAIHDADDDVLLVQVRCKNSDAVLFPILFEYYRADDDLPRIDALDRHWSATIALALPEIDPTRLFDAVLCIREAVLNGLKHGCSAPGDECSLLIQVDDRSNEAKSLKIEVRDPGMGYDFFLPQDTQPGDIPRDAHRGFTLLHILADEVIRERNGAVLRLTLDLSRLRTLEPLE